MLKIVAVARCDHCGGIRLVEDLLGPRTPGPLAIGLSSNLLPEGWVTAESEGETFHFCCEKHRTEWLHL